jgi:hypothetical protein
MSMRYQRLAMAAIIFAMIFGLGLGGGVIITHVLTGGLGVKRVNTAAVIQQVRTLSELVTVQYVIEKVIILEDVKYIAVLGENRVLMVAHGKVKAGVDLSRLEPGDISVSGQRMTIKLPPPQITDAYLDEEQTRVVERSTGLIRMFDKDLEQAARQQAVDDIRRAARNAGILKDADTRARAQIRALFQHAGLEVDFK